MVGLNTRLAVLSNEDDIRHEKRGWAEHALQPEIRPRVEIDENAEIG
jgi:hypothetical protein